MSKTGTLQLFSLVSYVCTCVGVCLWVWVGGCVYKKTLLMDNGGVP